MKKISLILFTLFLIFFQLYSQVSEKNKKNAKTAYNSAVGSIRSMDFQVALTYLDAAVELDPELNEALIQRAKVKVELGNINEAMKDFALAGEKDPKNGEPDFYMAYLPFKYDTAKIIINRFNSSIIKGFKEPQVFYYRGLYYLLNKEYSNAINDFTKAIEYKANYYLAYHDMGCAKWALGDVQGALNDFRMAVDFNQKFDLAYNNMGRVKAALGNFEGAIADVGVAISLNPDFYVAYNNRGAAIYYLGHPDSAIIDFDRALTLQPDYLPAINNRAACLSKQTANAEAIILFDEIIKSDTSFGRAYLNRGLARELTGNLDGACSDWKKASELGVKDAEKYIKECK
jgi:tetratricopeptide (TPR) repeat protein